MNTSIFNHHSASFILPKLHYTFSASPNDFSVKRKFTIHIQARLTIKIHFVFNKLTCKSSNFAFTLCVENPCPFTPEEELSLQAIFSMIATEANFARR